MAEVKRGTDKTGPFYRFGKTGAKHRYKTGNVLARRIAADQAWFDGHQTGQANGSRIMGGPPLTRRAVTQASINRHKDIRGIKR